MRIKNRLKSLLLMCLLAAFFIPTASALEYTFEETEDYLFGRPTSQDVIYEDENVNVNRSKTAALIPPGFGTPTSYLPGSGEYLTPNLAPGGMSGGLVNAVGNYSYTDSGSGGYAADTSISAGNYLPAGNENFTTSGNESFTTSTFGQSGTIGYTDVTSDL